MTAVVALSGLLATSCNDLDQIPHAQSSAQEVFSTDEGCFSALTKIYASFITTGQAKNGNNDITSNMGQDFLRCYINLQEAPTDEMASTWLSGDKMTDLTYMSWTNSDPWVSDAYYRLYYSIILTNNFLINTAASNSAKVNDYRYEARFLRALAYSYVLDLFGKGPFVDEKTGIGDYIPAAYTNKQLFSYIEDELKDVVNHLPSKDDVVYGRVSKGAAWALLARLYLNAEVYGAGDHYQDCINACDEVMKMGYSLEPEYAKLFNADNHKRTNEIIMPFVVDAENTVTWGATTYLVCGAIGSSAPSPSLYGAKSGWGNFRVRNEFYRLFETSDSRGMFYDNDSPSFSGPIDNQKEGQFGAKFTNLTDDGEAASNTASDGVNTDYPLIRLAEVILTKAEAILRIAEKMPSSSQEQQAAKQDKKEEARPLIKMIRDRAFGSDQNILDDQLSLAFILDERGRELWWECSRRTDLIRFGYFTSGSYLWQWKGGVLNGRGVDETYKTYPIPAEEQEANPNLKN